MKINTQTLNWLLEEDNPSIRYLALRDLADSALRRKHLASARQLAYSKGAIGKILSKMKPEGYWVKPGPGYSPKYKSIVWSLISLAQLGAHVSDDQRIVVATQYYMDHAFSEGGHIAHDGRPSGTFDCLQGNMCAALTELGVKDSRLDEAYNWLARSITGEGVEKYNAYKCGPGFVCGANGKLPCAWGAIKLMWALSKIPVAKRSAMTRRAIQMGVDFLLGTDPVKADYPTRNGIAPSRDWWKFGFPMFYISDLLQNVEVLVDLGYGQDPRLKNAIEYIYQKQDAQGRWLLEYDYAGKSWINTGEKRKPSKWVTYRALKVLKSTKPIH